MPPLLPQNMLPALTLQVGPAAGGLAWSHDGARIATYGDYGRVITVWGGDGRQLAVLRRAVAYYGNSLAFLGHGGELVTPLADDAGGREADALTVWDLQRHAAKRDVPGPAPGRPVQYNRAVAFTISPDGEELAVITSLLPDQPLTIYRTSDWAPRASVTMPAHDGALSVAFSPDGQLLAVGTLQGRVLVWDVRQVGAQPRVIVAFSGMPSMGVESLAFSPDSRLLATGGGLPIGNDVPGSALSPLRVWHVADGTLAAELHGGFAPVRELSWNADGHVVAAAAGDRTVRLFDIRQDSTANAETIQLAEPVTGARFSPDGRQIAAACGSTVLVFDLHR